jgi:hypothetical protein
MSGRNSGPGALAQSRNLDGKNVKPIVQIAAESAFGDQLAKVAVGGGHHANVDALRAVAAEALEFLLLEHAKKFGLQLQRNVGDFVEKERAAIGQLEAADFLAYGAGERAAFVAEEFRLEKAGGNRGAIDFDESAFAPRAAIVDGAGDEFLAGAGLAQNEHGGSGRSDQFQLRQSALERGTFSDDFLEIEFAANLLFQIEFFFGELVLERVDFLES